MYDIVITWPRSRTLEDYLEQLALAAERGDEINFRVPTLPLKRLRHCYAVHDGAVRGWSQVLDACYRGPSEVSIVTNDTWGGFWPEGNYIVRSPHWHAIDPIPMKSFQGWRYFERVIDDAAASRVHDSDPAI